MGVACLRRLSAVVRILLLCSVPAISWADSSQSGPASDPHGDPEMCDTCHTRRQGGAGFLRIGDVSDMCISCHNGRRAPAEVHPVNLKPSEAMLSVIPTIYPLEKGQITCLTCHDPAWACDLSKPPGERNPLRGPEENHLLSFCYRCHNEQKYRPFNAHHQIEAGRMKVDTCLWCHAKLPDRTLRLQEGDSYALRHRSEVVCSNCHKIAKGHPGGGSHMNAIPTDDMIAQMAAFEMQAKMKLDFDKLLAYVRAAGRKPRSIPLDQKGRITCYTCHNPHQEGLLPPSNPRSIGAEGEDADNHRLRAVQGNMCVVCHYK